MTAVVVTTLAAGLLSLYFLCLVVLNDMCRINYSRLRSSLWIVFLLGFGTLTIFLFWLKDVIQGAI